MVAQRCVGGIDFRLERMAIGNSHPFHKCAKCCKRIKVNGHRRERKSAFAHRWALDDISQI